MSKNSGKMVLSVGTRKGEFVFSSDRSRREWKVSGPHHKGNEVYHMVYDRRNKALMASVNS